MTTFAKATATIQNGYFGVVMETSGILHNPPYYEFAARFPIANNQFRNFTQSINVEAVRGSVTIVGKHNDATTMTRILTLVFGSTQTALLMNWITHRLRKNKNITDRILIANNTCVGASIFFSTHGTILAGKIVNNLFIGKWCN